jgi:hypothetical protein
MVEAVTQGTANECAMCGTRIPDGGKFCPQCGMGRGDGTAVDTKSDQTQTLVHLIGLAVMAIAIVVVLVLLSDLAVMAIAIVVVLVLLSDSLFGGGEPEDPFADAAVGVVEEPAVGGDVDQAAAQPDPNEVGQAAPAGGDEGNTPAGGDTDEGADLPTREELEAQEPIALTDGKWRLVSEISGHALWDFQAMGDGTCETPHPDVYSCTYFEDGPVLKVELKRVTEIVHEECSTTVDETHTFTMNRIGNIAYGNWNGEPNWRFSCDQGLVIVPDDGGSAVHARPVSSL